MRNLYLIIAAIAVGVALLSQTNVNEPTKGDKLQVGDISEPITPISTR